MQNHFTSALSEAVSEHIELSGTRRATLAWPAYLSMRHLFVFRSDRDDLIKFLWHAGQGMCLFAKRLDRGKFIWPTTMA